MRALTLGTNETVAGGAASAGARVAEPAAGAVPTNVSGPPISDPSCKPVLRGKRAYLGGVAAEDIVARDYQRRGRPVAHRRWRAGSGEIDLIARDGAQVIFIEVKKSRTFAQAACRLGRRQMDRLCAAASEFLAGEPKGLLTDMRFDLALVDALGGVQIIENAFGEA